MFVSEIVGYLSWRTLTSSVSTSRRTECNWSIWQWPECSCVPESQNQSQYTFVLQVDVHQHWVSWKLQLVGGDLVLHIEYDFQVSAYSNSFRDINYKDPYRDMVCFFSQDQHLFLNLFVTLNQGDISKYVQKGHLLIDMCKEEQNLKRVNCHIYYNRNTVHSLYLFMRFI